MRQKQWCVGGDGYHLAVPLRPSSLVACPECGRRNLSGEEPPVCGAYGPLSEDDILDPNGDKRLVVPRHTQGPKAKEWQANQAARANDRAVPSDHRCSPHCTVCE